MPSWRAGRSAASSVADTPKELERRVETRRLCAVRRRRRVSAAVERRSDGTRVVRRRGGLAARVEVEACGFAVTQAVAAGWCFELAEVEAGAARGGHAREEVSTLGEARHGRLAQIAVAREVGGGSRAQARGFRVEYGRASAGLPLSALLFARAHAIDGVVGGASRALFGDAPVVAIRRRQRIISASGGRRECAAGERRCMQCERERPASGRAGRVRE